MPVDPPTCKAQSGLVASDAAPSTGMSVPAADGETLWAPPSPGASCVGAPTPHAMAAARARLPSPVPRPEPTPAAAAAHLAAPRVPWTLGEAARAAAGEGRGGGGAFDQHPRPSLQRGEHFWDPY